ncbi:MAG: trans-sulfuration enzyme family protein [Woeseiaceae bacterium]|nr:PLP-dependent aspartate aminotransferase family protein [Woeseiaceae bacterium]|tara:strand:+ start:84 stop:1241 length:1158 start_codon:yes stop_codon:yes gene_type:complete
MRFRSKQIHAGVTPDPTTGAILTPIYQSTTFVQESVDSYLAKGYSYSRSGNPTVRALEKKLAELEGGYDATCYGTGMSAVNCTMLAFLSAGDHAIISDVAYGGTYRLCTKVLSRFGVEFSFADTSNPDDVKSKVKENTKLFLTETPANPTMKLSDIAAISEIAKAANAVHVVDNTLITPCYQRAIELGADLSLHSTTKYFDGHNATVGGAVIARTKELDEKIRFIQNSTGSIMSPMVAWLTLQGCKTLSVRMEAQSANALAIARFLESHPKVKQVAYPGLESFPQHQLAKSQSSGFGAMLWFEVEGGLKAGKQLMDSIELWTLAENLGSVESLITHPVTMTHADVDEAERKRVGIIDGLVRLSVGLEDGEDLIEALGKALEDVEV